MVIASVWIFLCMTRQSNPRGRPGLKRRTSKEKNMGNKFKAAKYCVPSLVAMGLLSVAHADSATDVADIIAVGPVEFVDANSVSVLGRSFHVGETSGLETGV